MKHLVGGWIGALLGCIALLGIDHWLRSNGHFTGLGEDTMKLGLALIAAAAAIAWYRGLAGQPLPLRIVLVGLQLAAGYLITLGLAIAYSCMAGLGCIA
ncbi:MAG TPA: hypothetical protein PK724_03105 [Pseudomonadales bacterium]|nr:hypothetical protein [Pseudomonadales bacterium]